MKKHIIKVLLIQVFLLVLAGVALAGAGIEILDATFNFGKVAQHANITHKFWIKSTGTDTLVIGKVVPGCGCTKAPLKDSVLAPGDSTVMEIIFSTKSYVGYVTKKPYLETNASEEKVMVTIHAELFPEPEKMTPLQLNPFRLDVSQFTIAPRRKGTFEIINVTDREYQITPIDISGKSFTVTLPEKIGPGETVIGTVWVNEDAIESAFEQSLTFEINDDGLSRYTLPVRRHYRPRTKE